MWRLGRVEEAEIQKSVGLDGRKGGDFGVVLKGESVRRRDLGGCYLTANGISPRVRSMPVIDLTNQRNK
jgi:hypothetical protein